MTTKSPSLFPPTGLTVRMIPTGQKPGSFTVNGKSYHVDTLLLTEFGGTDFKATSVGGAKMLELAGLIQAAVQRKIDSGELDPNHLPDNLSLEFSRKQFRHEDRSPLTSWLLGPKQIENKHALDDKTPFQPSHLVFTHSGQKRKLPLDTDAGSTFFLANGVDFVSKKRKKDSPAHISGFVRPTSMDGSCALDAIRQAMVQKDPENYAHRTNDELREQTANQIQTNEKFWNDESYFIAVTKALRDAQHDWGRIMKDDADFQAVRNFTTQPTDNEEEKRVVVEFYARYIRHPGVQLDGPLFLAWTEETDIPFVVLVRSEDGSENPGYRVQTAAKGATAETAVFVVYDAPDHYLAVDHSESSFARRQAILQNYTPL
jgi:hypothetical protein